MHDNDLIYYTACNSPRRCICILELANYIILSHKLTFCSEEEINGAAFKDLSDDDLKEMGFKLGPRKNIKDIIKSLTQTEA